MTLPAPNLDDRSHRQLVEEAVRLIPQYCPDWTDHNPSDPGITLIELFAWMTEMMLYRLNRVPDKTYVTLLDLIGIRLQPPTPATAPVTFNLVKEQAEAQKVPRGVQLAAGATEAGRAIVFETTRDLWVASLTLTKLVSVAGGAITDHQKVVEGSRKPETIFAGTKQVERFLYLGDDRWSVLSEEARVDVLCKGPSNDARRLPSLVSWEYYNGKRWREVIPVGDRARKFSEGEFALIFRGPVPDIAQTEIDGKTSFWLRARLTGVPESESETTLDTIAMEAQLAEAGVPPEQCWANIASSIFLPVDLSKNFYPFSEEPKFDTTFYVASKDIFGKADANIRIEIVLTDPGAVDPPQPSDKLELLWEFWDGKNWAELGRSSPRGDEQPHGNYGFVDKSHAFSRDGEIVFMRPASWQQREISGAENFWLRVRLVAGDYGQPGRYEQEGKNWVWKDDRPLKPPSLRTFALRFSQRAAPLTFVYGYNDFAFQDFTKLAAGTYDNFVCFRGNPEATPALCMAFDRAFPEKPVTLYFRLAEEPPRDPEAALHPLLRRDETDVASQNRIAWEYHDGKAWVSIIPKDGTRHFAHSGIVEIDGPRGWQPSEHFAHKGYWLRARLEAGGYQVAPAVAAILPNTVAAENATTIRNEILGSSDGTPEQEFDVSHPPILTGAELWVRESEVPNAAELEKLKSDENGDTPVDVQTDSAENVTSVWVRWMAVETLFAAGPRDRHYRLDSLTGKVTFGDGRRGMAPPPGQSNIKMAKYRTGGGTVGNVGAGVIASLRQTVPYIDKARNYFPASGGANTESLNEAKERAPQMFRNRYRAVTAEDYEWLAREATPAVARAHAIAAHPAEGEVTVVLVPKSAEDTQGEKLIPPPQLLQTVQQYLDARRLLTTQVHVQKADYVEVSVHITVALVPGRVASDRVREEIERKVRNFVHPLKGGTQRDGWPFGKTLFKTDIYHLIEDVNGVEFIEGCEIYHEDRNLFVDKVPLKPNQMLHLVDVNITESRRDF
jgi:hypothetical protein